MLKIGLNWGKIANYSPIAQQKSAPLALLHFKSNQVKVAAKKNTQKVLVTEKNYLSYLLKLKYFVTLHHRLKPIFAV